MKAAPCRAAGPEDIPALGRLLDAAFGRPGYEAAARRLIAGQLGRFWCLDAPNAPDTPNGSLTACAALVTYDRVAYLGLVATDPACQGRGFGRQVVDAALAATALPVRLDATALGAPLYEKFGFRVVEDIATLHSPVRPDMQAASPTETSLTETDWTRLLAQDRQQFQADRSRVLRALAAEPDSRWAVLPQNRGFALMLPRSVGPVWAETDADRLALLEAAIPPAPSPRILSLPRARTALLDELLAKGWQEVRQQRHMLRGDHQRPSGLVIPVNFQFG